MTMRGIDVSHWQGVIDWQRVKNSGIDGVIIKAGGSDAGFYTDSKFTLNYKGATNAGLHVGAYYFVGSKCKSYADGKADAERFIKMLNGKTFDLPVYMDFEAPDATTKQGNTDAVKGFCNTLENAGYFAGVYASDISGFNDRLYLSQIENRYSIWVARYGSSPRIVKNYGIWQYSSSGYVPGINGRVDLDYIYTDFPSIIKTRGLNGYSTKKRITKTVINAVIRGDYGNGAERVQRLTAAGYNADEVQKRVNETLKNGG